MHSAKEVMDDRLADDLDAPEERSLTSTGPERYQFYDPFY